MEILFNKKISESIRALRPRYVYNMLNNINILKG